MDDTVSCVEEASDDEECVTFAKVDRVDLTNSQVHAARDFRERYIAGAKARVLNEKANCPVWT
jgi:N12 class adenine-specific DNA methylase